MFTGLSAFPLTPLNNDAVDEAAFIGLIQRLVVAGADSITALGSTGSYAYLTAAERARVVELAVEQAGETPVFAGIGALRTSHVLAHAEAAQQAGAQALLLAPVSYQTLTDDEVFCLFRAVTREASVPVVVYDNPGTTHFSFSTELYGRIAELAGIASIKIPPVPHDIDGARQRIRDVRAVLPDDVTVGVSGDPTAATGLIAGADIWYSVIAGILPEPALRITRAVQQGQTDRAQEESEGLTPLWELFRKRGSLRVAAAIAEQLNLAPQSCLPLPIRGLDEAERQKVDAALKSLVW
ncbi:dihydrodipicolinate synthase family protein [Nesterenkonia sp. NBAIMH1]|uniref:dihydrodipicolinate synthase family protein n=1 Tax=Nesterenkonia sp. NBAIMH1 TaxID=2600320 RepID=UPI0011B5F515|nr:dihydrodipicolinate synthase family protein [Nesterenkonia sp. NBAIMH1]